MTLIGIKLSLKQFWTWVKKNWKITVLAVWSVLVWVLSRRSSKAAIEIMNANKESYEAQIQSLKEQRKIERSKVEELHLKYKETIDTIEEKYKIKEKELTRKEKKKVKEIVKQAKEDPVEINNKIENLFGFTPDN